MMYAIDDTYMIHDHHKAEHDNQHHVSLASSFTTTWCVPTPHHFNNVMYIEHFDTLLAWLPGVKRRSLQRSLSLAATVSS